jgi:MFS family permease
MPRAALISIKCERGQCDGRPTSLMHLNETGRIARKTCRGSSMPQSLPPNVIALGCVSLLMGMSSAMIYGLLPVFLVVVLGANVAVLGVIEGSAEATTSFTKVASGIFSDWLRRRKPLVLLGYGLSAVNKLLFPIAASASTIMLARVADRIGKGIRDAPRDAFLADVVPVPIRGSGFGLRLTLYTIGAVAGPLVAMSLMSMSGGDFRLVFWLALIPAFASVGTVLLFVREGSGAKPAPDFTRIRGADLLLLPAGFWRTLAIAALFALARFSPAFLVLKAHDIGVETAFVPMALVLMYVFYSAAAYPFGILADHIDRRMQLGFGAAVLIAADLILAFGGSVWLAALGTALWGLQMGMTQGLLAASIADAAPRHLRGTAFGLYDFGIGLATLMASTIAGVLWAAAGAGAAFGIGAAVAMTAIFLLLLKPKPVGEPAALERSERS